MILEKTVELIKQIYRYHKIFPPKVTRVIVGSRYTAVEVAAYSYDPFLGLAYTIPSVVNGNQADLAGLFDNQSLEVLLQWAYNPPSLEKMIGIAAVNALSQHILEIINPYKTIKGDIVDYLKIDEDKKVTFIGQIKPLIEHVNRFTDSILIIDDNPSISEQSTKFPKRNNISDLEDDEIFTDILFCTGSSLINNTLEEILVFFRKKSRKTVVIGPSASMIPDILFDSGVDIVGGMTIIDRESTINVIKEGGGTKMFKNYGEKYNLIKE